MRVRGERTCRDCGANWSYFETGSVACPECGSVRSTGRGDRERHTDRENELDLTATKAAAADGDLDTALDTAADVALEYVRHRGFIDAGDLRDLDEEYLFAQELRHASTIAASRLDLADDERAYLLQLFEAAPPARPPAEAVPDGLRAARGLAAATAVRDYLDELRTWLADEREGVSDEVPTASLDDHVTRIRALDGEIPPEAAEELITAARAIGRYCRERDDDALESATSAVESLGEF